MLTASSPKEPMFWSHHALIDLLHTIFFECRAKGLPKNDPKVFSSCSVRNGRDVDRYSVVNMLAVEDVPGQNVDETPATQAWFADVPNKYYDLSDVTQLGKFSYNYEMSGFLKDMLTNCDNVVTNNREDAVIFSLLNDGRSRQQGGDQPFSSHGGSCQALREATTQLHFPVISTRCSLVLETEQVMFLTGCAMQC
ncbi:hypothetical protein SDRG_04535 [Saprolegnia diclina VS20]|uniref:Tyrosinase copper-binding domain-containing protein n=1 Tax=Saprolegnia diclina (strain VS20) TaxID=1156394 RepID=T0QVQ5_SAPDV|nr:hypothetical protein SDRG_04535 [Saprolegnia diclina VS20]EQC38105.1 hypothetical protein SDRG_04535 [Saprolegnia diclina VS20]|eukprot:XP_008608432.1 hypothetical protein SDRG_04535 [Saprolegnia diclina VS20]